MLNNKLLIQKSQWKADTQSGEAICFEACKGGYFSNNEEYGLSVVGKTFQEGLSGRNLLNYSTMYRSHNGIVFTPVEDGVLIDGTSKSLAISGSSYFENPQVGKTYFVSANHPDITIRMDVILSSGAVIACTEYKADGTEQKIEIKFFCPVGKTFDNFLVKPQLEEGGITTFEPYCGGMPAPNPDFPIPIQCVKQGTKIKCCGKNLLDYSAMSRYHGKIDYTPVKDGVIMNGTSTSTAISGSFYFENPQVGKTYFVSVNHPDVTINMFVTLSDGRVGAYAKHTFDGTEQEVEIKMYCSAGKTFDNFLVKPQLEEGGITPFEPYVESEITTPCDLYEGDIWYPTNGKVEKYNRVFILGEDNLTGYEELTEGLVRSTVSGYDTVGSSENTPHYCNCLLSTQNHITENLQYSSSTTKMWVNIRADRLPSNDLAGIIAYFENLKSNGKPAIAVGRLEVPDIECGEHLMQFISAPCGTVNVFQVPTELSTKVFAVLHCK